LYYRAHEASGNADFADALADAIDAVQIEGGGIAVGLPIFSSSLRAAPDELYEALGTRAAARITPTFDHASVAETDLLERPLPEPVALDGDRLRLRPFQIVTLRFERR